MRNQIRELRFLVGLLEADLDQKCIDGTSEPELWSSVALMLREVVNRSLLLRVRALELVPVALELNPQTLL